MNSRVEADLIQEMIAIGHVSEAQARNCLAAVTDPALGNHRLVCVADVKKALRESTPQAVRDAITDGK